MEEATSGDERYQNSLIFKKSVEFLFKKIQEIAEQEPEEAENCKNTIFCLQNRFKKQFNEKIHLLVILTLSDLLGTVVDRALDLIDNSEIKLLRSQQTGRELFEVPAEDASTSAVHRLFTTVPFCNCRAFNQVIQGEEYCCKHYIACRIARALGKVTVVEIAHSEFREALKFFEL